MRKDRGKTKKKYGFKPDYTVAPGETLQEVMESLGMNQKELAKRTGLTVQSLICILKGTQPITNEIANRLELATGVSASMWNNLEVLFSQTSNSMSPRPKGRD